MRPYLDSTRANVDAMGNTLRTACYYLKDPNLVRAIQERLGVKQIIPLHTQTADGTADAGDVPAVSVSHDLSVSAINGHGDNLGWLSTKVKRRKRLKPPGSSAISPPSSPESEDSKLPDIIVETLPVLDIFFRLATELGYEPFYITFLPFFVWNIDTYMTRHVIIMWIWSMYLGQACKALFQWKRPSSPPAIRLENNPSLETEYGFPSTHAIVSTTIPFYLAYCAYFRYKVYNKNEFTVHSNTIFLFSCLCGLDCLWHRFGVALCVSVDSTWACIHHWLALEVTCEAIPSHVTMHDHQQRWSC